MMQDLTKGPVGRHIVQLSAFIALSTVFQTLYFLADLYFVGRLGKEALAGVGLAGNLMMAVLALTQSLGVGTTSLVAQAMGAGNPRRAGRVFNQALVLSLVAGLGFFLVGFAARHAYARWLAADPVTADFGVRYLDWFVPALALQFPLVAMGAALRGIGDMKVPTLLQILTVVLNIVLAPVLMFGWGTGRPLGGAGTARASVIAVCFGCVVLPAYFRWRGGPLRFARADWPPDLKLWGQVLRIGLPAGGEFALIALYLMLVYDIIRPFGAAAQAGFGTGARVMQALFLPAVAIGFATAPVAGQNFGARLGERVRETFRTAASMSVAVMVVLTAVCQVAPARLVGVFTSDPGVVAFGSQYLRIISWNFVASGVVFVTSSVFQGMGHTLPPLIGSTLRLVLFAVPAYALSRHPGFEIRHVWYLSLASVFVQVGLNLWFLRREFARRLGALDAAPAVVAV
jgi:putative MATE family efflux protein